MAEPTPTPLPSGFKEALEKATESWVETYNAGVRANRRGRGSDRAQFMEDIGKGWIVPEDWNPDAAELGWGLAAGIPTYRKALGMSAKEELDDGTAGRSKAMGHGFRTERGKAGRHMGRGSLGTPVYVDPGLYGGALVRSKEPYTGKMGVFAPEGRYLTTGGPSTGTLGHELGHAKQHLMEDEYIPKRDREPGRKLFRHLEGFWSDGKAHRAASEAVAGYLGRRVIRSKKGWGAAADDKSWAAYSGLPSYLRSLEGEALGDFLRVVREYEEQYPGIYDETMRAIKEYDTLVAPKSINDTSKGDWSKEGLEYMKKWRKEKGLKEVPTGSTYEKALEMGPYSQVLGTKSESRAV